MQHYAALQSGALSPSAWTPTLIDFYATGISASWMPSPFSTPTFAALQKLAEARSSGSGAEVANALRAASDACADREQGLKAQLLHDLADAELDALRSDHNPTHINRAWAALVEASDLSRSVSGFPEHCASTFCAPRSRSVARSTGRIERSSPRRGSSSAKNSLRRRSPARLTRHQRPRWVSSTTRRFSWSSDPTRR